jgi:hypothetical protein
LDDMSKRDAILRRGLARSSVRVHCTALSDHVSANASFYSLGAVASTLGTLVPAYANLSSQASADTVRTIARAKLGLRGTEQPSPSEESALEALVEREATTVRDWIALTSSFREVLHTRVTTLAQSAREDPAGFGRIATLKLDAEVRAMA